MITGTDQEWSPVVREKIIRDVRTTNSKHPQVDQVHLSVKVHQGRAGGDRQSSRKLMSGMKEATGNETVRHEEDDISKKCWH